jgi:asparagine synthase (glutamine-hydrolysing)
MIPPPSDRDGEDVKERYSTIVSGEAKGLDGETYYGYKEDLYHQVTASFRKFGLPVETSNVHLVKGLFEDMLRPEGAVAVAHLDGDWYDSIMVCLERLWPVLANSGVIIIDDYYAWSGCRRAVDDFTAMHADCKRQERSRLHLVKAPR